MAESRTLKLSILGDVDNLKKSLASANSDVESSSYKIGDFSKKAGLAFAAAGAAAAIYAGKLLIDGVKSAIEDEAAQAKLATTLQNVAGATDAQVAAVERYILQTELATGKTDDELRPSLERLARATGDVQKAQDLQTLALDIAAGSGKSLEAVSNALGKAYEGNTGALGKLGVGISSAELKTMSFDEVVAALSKTFENQASIQAETFEGKMARLKVAVNEAKETVGSFVLNAITPMVNFIVQKVVPALMSFSDTLGKNLGKQFTQIAAFIKDELIPVLVKWWKFLYEEVIPAIMKVVTPILEGLFSAFNQIKKAIADNSTELEPFYNFLHKVWEFISNYLAPLLGGAFKIALQAIGYVVSSLIGGFASLVSFITGAYNILKSFIDLILNNPVVSGIANVVSNIFGGGMAAGGSVTSGTPYLVGEQGAELFVPSSSGSIVPNNKLGGGSTTININVSGAIDQEGTARTIVNLLNNSFFRGTGGAGNLQTT